MVFSKVVGLVLMMVGFRFVNGVPVAKDFVYVDVDAVQIVSITGFQYRWNVFIG